MPTRNYKTALDTLTNKIEKGNYRKNNKELLLDFSRDLKIHDYSDARNYKLVTHIKRIIEENEIDLEKATKEDLKDVLYWVKTNDDFNSPETKKDYRVAIKVFYKWLKNGDPTTEKQPELVS